MWRLMYFKRSYASKPTAESCSWSDALKESFHLENRRHQEQLLFTCICNSLCAATPHFQILNQCPFWKLRLVSDHLQWFSEEYSNCWSGKSLMKYSIKNFKYWQITRGNLFLQSSPSTTLWLYRRQTTKRKRFPRSFRSLQSDRLLQNRPFLAA